MKKLNEKKRKWLIDRAISGELKTKEIAQVYNITQRWIQALVKEYKETGVYPVMKNSGRPRTELTNEDKESIDKAIEESLLSGAVSIRLYIEKHYGKKIPYNKIHQYLLSKGISQEDRKKKKQRKYCKYQRKHSFSLVHLDWHDSKCFPGKYVCSVIDDRSRKILSGGEFDSEEAKHAIKITKEAINVVWNEYSAVIKQANTDKGTQFYNSTLTKEGERPLSEFEKFLVKQGIKHIPSRRNHPQTNGKEERWFRTYEENREKFKSFKAFVDWYNDRIHLGLNRKKGETPNEVVIEKLRPESILGLFFRRLENEWK